MLFPASVSCTTHHDTLPHRLRTSRSRIAHRSATCKHPAPTSGHPPSHPHTSSHRRSRVCPCHFSGHPSTGPRGVQQYCSHPQPHAPTHHDTLPHRLRTSLLVSLTGRPRANTLTRLLTIHPVTHILAPICVVLSTVSVFVLICHSTLISVRLLGDHNFQVSIMADVGC